MVKYQLSFHANIVGPYGLFSGPSGQFTVGREVDTSSQSSEVSKFISKASRFSSTGQLYGISLYADGDDIPSAAEIKEYAIVEDIVFSYDSDVDEPMYIAAGVFGSVIKIFGGWRAFLNDVVRGGHSCGLCFDEDGMDYERLVEYAVRLKLIGGETERLMKLEGISLWNLTLSEEY